MSATFQDEGTFQVGYIELQELPALNQSSVNADKDLGRSEPGVLNGFGNQSGVEGSARPGVDYPLSLDQTHVGMVNAVQALQGFLSPFRSKPSYHAVDFDGGLHNLGGSGRSNKNANQSK